MNNQWTVVYFWRENIVTLSREEIVDTEAEALYRSRTWPYGKSFVRQPNGSIHPKTRDGYHTDKIEWLRRPIRE